MLIYAPEKANSEGAKNGKITMLLITLFYTKNATRCQIRILLIKIVNTLVKK